MSPFSVRRPTIEETGNAFRVSALIDGFEVWFRVAGVARPGAAGDALLCLSLVPAMAQGKDLSLEVPVSPRLLAATDELQEAFSHWRGLPKIRVQAEVRPPAAAQAGVGTFFSGGVDGLFTFLRHRQDVSHLLFVRGIDMQIDNDPLFAEVLRANRAFAEEHGKTLVVIETNFRKFYAARGLRWTNNIGGSLACVAHLVGLSTTLIPATDSYDQLYPASSHPLTDRLWSSEVCALVHDGLVRRSEKLRCLGETPNVLRNLRVCWMDAGYNCGTCSKCLRTRVTLRLLKLTCATLPPLESVRALSAMRIEDKWDYAFFVDNLRLAESVGDAAVARVLRRRIARWKRRQALAAIDEGLTGGVGKRLWHWVKGR